MKKKSLWLIGALFTALSTQAFAGHDDDLRLIAAASKNAVTVAQAAKLPDDTAVTVTGTIVRQIKHEHYEIKDGTGVINVEIDDDLATASQLKKGTKIRVMGEVDTHRYKPSDIEAVKVEFVR